MSKRSKKTQIRMAGVMGVTILLFVSLIIGCSSDDNSNQKTLSQQALDSVASAVVDEVVDAAFASAPVDENAVFAVDEPEGSFIVTDMLAVDSLIYAIYNGGVIVYDLNDRSTMAFPVDERFTAITLHDGKIYVGGENLYTIDDTILNPAEGLFDGEIQSLYSWEYSLMIGTDMGLYSNGVFGNITLTEEFQVTNMTADESGGLWVGSMGCGLFRWDGERFNERYLLRDTTIFENVNSLEFNHGHLYVGTDNGFFIYNGGSWQQLTTIEGLPSNQVRDIDASDWVINIATDNGAISYFNGDFLLCGGLDDKAVNAFCPHSDGLIAATSSGVVLKSGSDITTLFESVPEIETEDAIEKESIAVDDEIIPEEDELVTVQE